MGINWVLGIETSCDETGVALYHPNQGIAAHYVYTQTLHQAYGGVVPELASRDHLQKLLPLIEKSLKTAGISTQELDGIAYTSGPGLMGALLVGAVIGKSLALALNIPSKGIHHLEAHILAAQLSNPEITFPFLTLLVSGGHTMLLKAHAFRQYEIIGQTLDDAAGEAFDKIAKILGLPYPGGPHLAKLAEQGNPERFRLSRPMLDRPNLDFSFSGLKTQAYLLWQRLPQDDVNRQDVARALEEAIVETLSVKCQRAITATELDTVVVAGGVAANKRLRETLAKWAAHDHIKLFFPPIELCTDNGAMVAYTGYQYFKHGLVDTEFSVKARWELPF